jgi:hypothetical protein
MKRPHPPFVVEVRKQRRSTNGNGKSWLTESRFAGAITETAGASDPLARFEAPPAPPAETPAETAPARPTGRILPSLIDLAPTGLAAEEAEPPRRGRRGAASAKRKAKRETPRETEPTNAPAAEHSEVALDAVAAAARASAALEIGAATSAGQGDEPRRPDRHRRVMERYVFGGVRKPGQRWKLRLLEARK